MKAGGQSFTSTNATSVALLYCDQLWLLERALVGRTPTLSGLTAGIEQVGTRAPSANLGAASYGPGKHVGVARGVEFLLPANMKRRCVTRRPLRPPLRHVARDHAFAREDAVCEALQEALLYPLVGIGEARHGLAPRRNAPARRVQDHESEREEASHEHGGPGPAVSLAQNDFPRSIPSYRRATWSP